MVDPASGVKPDGLVIGSVALGATTSAAELQRHGERAAAAGFHALRIPYRRDGVSVAAGGTGQGATGRGRSATGRAAAPELQPSDIGRVVQAWLGRLAVAVGVYDLLGLEAIARLDGVAMLAISAPAAVDPRLVARAAETGLPTLLEVNLLSAVEIDDVTTRFAPGQLTLMWSQLGPRSSALEIVEDLFALIRLRRHGCLVGYAAVSYDPVALAIAIGFGAVVLEIPIGEPGAGFGAAMTNVRVELERLLQTRDDIQGQLLRASDLDLVDDLRPSLVAARPIRRGEALTADMMACRAPGRGLSPGFLPRLVGRRALYDIDEGDPLTFGLIDL